MRILHVYKDYSPILGGIENHIKTLAELQAGASHQVTVLVTNPGGKLPEETINGVQVMRLPRLATIASAPLSLAFLTAIPRIQADITHLHFPYPVGEFSNWLTGRGRPYVITYHSDIVRQQSILRLYRPVLQRVLAKAGRILPTSENYIASSPFLSPLKEKCTVVPLSVDPAPFENPSPLFPSSPTPRLLFLGRHRYYKGVDTLLRALPGLAVELVIGGDGPYRARWEKLAQELGIGNQVVFTGEVSDADLPRLYASADIFILPANARAEAFGKVLLEAMAAGLPCITSELGTGTSFVVQDGVTGLVVPPREPDALRAAIQRLVEAPEQRKALGAAGKRRVLENFTPEKLRDRVGEVYEEVVRKT